MMTTDAWVQQVLIEVMKEVTKYLMVKELKPKLEKKIPSEKKQEFTKRLSESISRLRIKDTDVVMKLKDYPGLLSYLKDESFRKKFLRVDTGGGLVILDSKVQAIMEQFIASQGVLQYRILQMIRHLHENALIENIYGVLNVPP